jgi:hypothetical protein
MRLPKNRGHFWVERDNQIIDFNFPQYCRLRRKFNADPETNCYLRASPKVEEAIIRLYRRITLKAFDCDNWDDMMIEFIFVATLTGNADAPTFNKSFTNAIQEVYHNGGEIRFGSMGFKKKDGTYHWYYADDQCKDMADFLL